MAEEGWEDAVEATAAGVRVLLEVHPGSARSAIEGLNPWRGRLIVAVRAPPTRGRANEEVVEVVAAALAVARADVRVSAGTRSGKKAIEVAGLDAATARRRLRRACKA